MKDYQRQRIIFWDHYDAGMGGIEKMIITLSNALAHSHEILIIANEGGVICKSLRETNTAFRRIDPARHLLVENIRAHDLLIAFGTYRELCLLHQANPQMLLWRVFPHVGSKNLVNMLLFRKMFEALDKKSSLFFMDNTCHETACRELRCDLSRRILPIPIASQEHKYTPRRKSDTINMTYVGRGSRIWKVKPVRKLVADLRTVKGQKFHLHIFTDTSKLYKHELMHLQGGNVIIHYHFGYTMARLSEKLLALSDVHYSMGTSALEGAILGIPTIIADASHEDLPPDYEYRWLHEHVDNYDVGLFADSVKVPSGKNIHAIVKSIRNPDEIQLMSELTHKKTREHFSCESICAKIAAIDTKARVRDVLRFMPSYWLPAWPVRYAGTAMSLSWKSRQSRRAADDTK